MVCNNDEKAKETMAMLPKQRKAHITVKEIKRKYVYTYIHFMQYIQLKVGKKKSFDILIYTHMYCNL